MELLDICLTTTYVHFENKFYQQEEGIAMENTLSSVVSDKFIEHFEETALATADHNPLNGSDTCRHIRGMITWISKVTAISSPSQQR
jgi:hypothetical protein